MIFSDAFTFTAKDEIKYNTVYTSLLKKGIRVVFA
jgi:hypothetical protein